MSEFDEAMKRHAELCKDDVLDQLRRTVQQQAERIKKLVAHYDNHAGTPCEQIRHQQEVDDLKRQLADAQTEIARLKAGIIPDGNSHL